MTPPPSASQLAPAVVSVPLSGDSVKSASHSIVAVFLRDVGQLVRPRITTMVLVTVAASAWITSSGSQLRVGELVLVFSWKVVLRQVVGPVIPRFQQTRHRLQGVGGGKRFGC